jgi:cytochrome P450
MTTTVPPDVSGIPAFDVDMYADDQLRNPYGVYEQLREAGPVVYLTRHNCFGFPRYAQVREALEDHRTYLSGKGVGLYEPGNQTRKGTPIASDPPYHTKIRGILNERLSLVAVRELQPDVQAQADKLVDEVLTRGSFDGVADFARQFPLRVMADLIGLPEDGRDKLLGWADAGFNLFGPENERVKRSIGRFPEVTAYIKSLEQPGRLREGSLGAAIYEAADRSVITREQAGPLMIAYLMAGLDTTINGISALVMMFGQNPDQWDMVRENPKLIPQAFNEAIRIESPIQLLRRVTSCDVEIEGVNIPADSPVLLMYGSANRDERRWPDANRFIANRNPVGHLAFGMGIHNCAGQHVARLEANCIFDAMVRKVKRIETGAGEWHLNNIIRGLETLPTKFSA